MDGGAAQRRFLISAYFQIASKRVGQNLERGGRLQNSTGNNDSFRAADRAFEAIEDFGEPIANRRAGGAQEIGGSRRLREASDHAVEMLRPGGCAFADPERKNR